MRNIFFQKSCRNEAGRIGSDLFLFFKEDFYKVKARGRHLSFNIFWKILSWTYNKNKLSNISNYRSRYMLNFDFL